MTSKQKKEINRVFVVETLTAIRKSWEEYYPGRNLVEQQTSIGISLLGMAEDLDLTPDEIAKVLGDRLIADLKGDGQLGEKYFTGA